MAAPHPAPAAAADDKAQGTKWCGTWHFGNDLPSAAERAERLMGALPGALEGSSGFGQLELAPETGMYHAQLFFDFTGNKRVSALRKCVDKLCVGDDKKLYITKANGSASQSWDYCTKGDSRVNDAPHSDGTLGPFRWRWGKYKDAEPKSNQVSAVTRQRLFRPGRTGTQLSTVNCRCNRYDSIPAYSPTATPIPLLSRASALTWTTWSTLSRAASLRAQQPRLSLRRWPAGSPPR